MASWSKRRRSTYAAVAVIILVGAVGLPLFLIFHKAPTCFDGILNGSEQGIDCGGSCARLCPSAFAAPREAWTRMEQVGPGSYNIAAYIINPNNSVAAKAVPYHMAVFDGQGILITDVKGTVDLPPQRNTLAFLPSVQVGKRIPSKVLFEFTGIPNWYRRADELAGVGVSDKRYSDDLSGSSLSVTLNNPGATSIGTVDVYAVLYDAGDNAIGFSKTVLDGIPAGGSSVAPFTWPINRQGRVVSIEVLPVAE